MASNFNEDIKVECQQILCNECAEQHANQKLSKHHNVIHLEINDHTQLKLSECEKHSKIQPTKYCIDCAIIVSMKSLEDIQNTHKKSDDVKEVTELLQEELKEAEDGVQGLNLLRCHDLRKQFLDSVLKAESDIAGRFEKVKQIIENHQMRLLEDLTMIKNRRLKEIENEFEENDKKLSELKRFLERVKSLSDKSLPSEIARIGKSLLLTTQRLKKNRGTERNVEEMSFYLTFVPGDFDDSSKYSTGSVIGTINESCFEREEKTDDFGNKNVLYANYRGQPSVEHAGTSSSTTEQLSPHTQRVYTSKDELHVKPKPSIQRLKQKPTREYHKDTTEYDKPNDVLLQRNPVTTSVANERMRESTPSNINIDADPSVIRSTEEEEEEVKEPTYYNYIPSSTRKEFQYSESRSDIGQDQDEESSSPYSSLSSLPSTPQQLPFSCKEIKQSEVNIKRRSFGVKYTEICFGTLGVFGVQVAVKRFKSDVNKDPMIVNDNDFFREAEILQRMKHPNIVKLLGVSRQTAPFYVITEMTSRGYLKQHLEVDKGTRIKFKEIVEIASQITNAMTFLAENFCIHRSLSARCILVGDNNSIKIAHFEMAVFIVKDQDIVSDILYAESSCKTQAPEVVVSQKWSTKSDVWSFGIVLYEMFTYGGEPYTDLANDDELRNCFHTAHEIPLPCGKNYHYSDTRLDNAMRSCWHKDAKKRPAFRYLFNLFKDFFEKEEKDVKGFYRTPEFLWSTKRPGSIRGITLYKDRFYVIRDDLRGIEVFNASHYRRYQNIPVGEKASKPAGALGLRDIASSVTNELMFVIDWDDSCIHRVDPVKKIISWTKTIAEGKPSGLSITASGTLIVSCTYVCKLCEYSSEGKSLRTITVGSNSEGPWHAIRIGNDEYVVCHGDGNISYPKHYVSVINGCNSETTDNCIELQRPYHLAVTTERQVLVAEHGRDRIVISSLCLDSMHALLTVDHGVKAPTRIHLDENSGRLFVGLQDGTILVFKVKIAKPEGSSQSASATAIINTFDGIDACGSEDLPLAKFGLVGKEADKNSGYENVELIRSSDR